MLAIAIPTQHYLSETLQNPSPVGDRGRGLNHCERWVQGSVLCQPWDAPKVMDQSGLRSVWVAIGLL